jgi:hypothetical protein
VRCCAGEQDDDEAVLRVLGLEDEDA